MGTRKSTVARILALGCAGFFCLGGSYTWTGLAGHYDPYWDEPENWNGSSPGEFPNDTNDDALFPTRTGDPWVAELVEDCSGAACAPYNIDDLTIEYSVIFTGTSDLLLTVDTLTIKGEMLAETIVEITTNGTAMQAKSCS